jgi:TRAP-type C4-dicarboxylate transport system substrate-binding protein
LRTKCLCGLLFCFLVIGLIAGACAAPSPTPTPTPTPAPVPSPTPAPSPAKVIELKGVNGTSLVKEQQDRINEYIKLVNERTGGEVKINWAGGPEVITGFDQGSALRSGAIDMLVNTPPEYYEKLMAVGLAMSLTEAGFAEERKIGMYDIWVECYKKYMNARYIGRIDGYLSYPFFSRKPVSKLDDFKGLLIRSTAMYDPMIKALGASSVNIPLPDLYTALERGTVDAYITLFEGAEMFKLKELSKYWLLEPHIFQASGTMAVNLDKWNMLSPKAQDVMINTLLTDVQPKVKIDRLARAAYITDVYNKAGMTQIKLSAEDSKKYVDIAYQTTWDQIVNKDTAYGPKFKAAEGKITTKWWEEMK